MITSTLSVYFVYCKAINQELSSYTFVSKKYKSYTSLYDFDYRWTQLKIAFQIKKKHLVIFIFLVISLTVKHNSKIESLNERQNHVYVFLKVTLTSIIMFYLYHKDVTKVKIFELFYLMFNYNVLEGIIRCIRSHSNVMTFYFGNSSYLMFKSY